MALSLQPSGASLVDQVEECLLSHFKCSNLSIGDPIPNENTFGRGARSSPKCATQMSQPAENVRDDTLVLEKG